MPPVHVYHLLPVRAWQLQEVVAFFSIFCLCVIVYHHQCNTHSCRTTTDPWHHPVITKPLAGWASQEICNISGASISSPGSGSTWWRSWARAKSPSSSPHTTLKRPGRPTWWDHWFAHECTYTQSPSDVWRQHFTKVFPQFSLFSSLIGPFVSVS